jgi:hypothetical protein
MNVTSDKIVTSNNWRARVSGNIVKDDNKNVTLRHIRT